MADSASDMNKSEDTPKVNSSSTKTNNKIVRGSQQEGAYSCDVCEYTSKFPSCLRQHIQTKHEGIRYPCDLCE